MAKEAYSLEHGPIKDVLEARYAVRQDSLSIKELSPSSFTGVRQHPQAMEVWTAIGKFLVATELVVGEVIRPEL